MHSDVTVGHVELMSIPLSPTKAVGKSSGGPAPASGVDTSLQLPDPPAFIESKRSLKKGRGVSPAASYLGVHHTCVIILPSPSAALHEVPLALAPVFGVQLLPLCDRLHELQLVDAVPPT